MNKELIEFRAEIEITDFPKNKDGQGVAYGKIFHDSKKAFPDGSEIITTLVQNTETYEADGYIKTQNSVYKIRHSNK
ncbi:hypothetical protein [Xenorhabdus siamensis]|uniref:hypothetical protein n=1 Tax=Xenorhabdus siamensis TaxID=3136254 RepID=UPI0030F394D1